ncbi:GNAT family N-acetyltransferase [Lentzea guizhouensis]|uniref:GNAT family N-acetyltransferase n=1 Tax=Lentzea guizhouensis TaxID=1586287 RepID=A0A1B2HF20_9PSEU|nr:GNAT family N-acetyltransferase [Lentzea guizhouensis]ANZ36296.1 GNAT family N-acetyltransferase [Lentzea guizhouensis]
MLKIDFLTGSDRAGWEELARGKDAHFSTDRTPADYDRAWDRLLGPGPVRGIGAWLDDRMVAVAHYVFHESVWGVDGRCYLADLFVDPSVRRQGVATSVIHRVAADARENGYRSLYWNTLADAPARALYDRVGTFHDGFIFYSYRRP